MARYVYNHRFNWPSKKVSDFSKTEMLDDLDDFELLETIVLSLRFDDTRTLEQIADSQDYPLEDVYLYAEKLAAFGILKVVA